VKDPATNSHFCVFGICTVSASTTCRRVSSSADDHSVAVLEYLFPPLDFWPVGAGGLGFERCPNACGPFDGDGTGNDEQGGALACGLRLLSAIFKIDQQISPRNARSYLRSIVSFAVRVDATSLGVIANSNSFAYAAAVAAA
jgi:hypothetical protein